MQLISQKLHRDLPPTQLYGYGGMSPGPTIETRPGVPVLAEFPNELPSMHILPVDESVCDESPKGRAVVHLHGGSQEWSSDGSAYAWFEPGYSAVGPYWRSPIYTWANTVQKSMLWYHDHSDCITRLNVYAGLAGLYILRGPREAGLPPREREMPLVLMDRCLYPNGSLVYPGDPDGDVPISIVPEFFGNISLVNGIVWPRMTVAPTTYRFRILDASNARFYNLRLYEQDNATGLPNTTLPGPGERSPTLTGGGGLG